MRPSGGETRRSLSRHPAFWAAFGLVAVGAVILAIRLFPMAFPQVGLEVEMDRGQALAAADEVADVRGWGPGGYRQAASFGETDGEFRTYLELDQEVEDAVDHLVREAGYHAYLWRVRHFREGEAREATALFTPAGELDGFTLEVPEDDPGPALSGDSARALAEAEATGLGIDLGPYELVETSTETRPSDRVDHTLVYELPDADLGDADARLTLGVAGDEVSEVRRHIRVPESFSRQYAEQRSANEAISMAASVVLLLLFGVVGCGGGIFYLIRRNALVAKPALVGGAVVAGIAGLLIINTIPLEWMRYDTAVPSWLFLLGRWGSAAGALVLGGAVLGAIFMAAEGLTRRARPEEPYIWRLWSRGVAETPEVLGRTVAGYLLAAIQVGFVTAFYFLAMQRPGWWAPSEALIQPDLLATYVPALNAISMSFLAGTWEEALIRAVPIAGAILLARRFGARGLLVVAAVAFQAVVFAAAHAGYPQQPAYARVVELVVPATAWGLIYLRFGLLPVVLAHFLYNLTMMSMPLFAAPAGLWLDRGLIAAAALLPLGVVLYRGRTGFRKGLPDEARNGFVDERVRVEAGARAASSGDHPRSGDREAGPGEGGPGGAGPEEVPGALSPGAEVEGEAGRAEAGVGPATSATVAPTVAGLRKWVLLLGALGAVAWLLSTPGSDVPQLELGAAEAEEAARAELAERGVELERDGPWEALPRAAGSPGRSHRFVWEEGGESAYRQLLEAGHLRGPHWVVRFARFTGSSEERAEEFRVQVGPQGEILRYDHVLPEGRAGEELEEGEARERAVQELRSAFGLEPDELEEVSAESDRMPERLDWSFVFHRPEVHPVEEGEARAHVRVSGDQVTDGYLDVHVPEAWERAREERDRRSGILGMASGGALLLLLGGAAVRGLVRWARSDGGFRTDALLFAGGVVGGALLLMLWNSWPGLVTAFDTAQPWSHQAFALVGLLSVLGAFVVAGLGLAAGFAGGRAGSGAREGSVPGAPEGGSGKMVALWGILLGVAVLGGMTVLREWMAPGGPAWPGHGGADTRLPLLAPALGVVVQYFAVTVVGLVLLASLRRALHGGGGPLRRAGVVCVLAGLVFASGFSGAGMTAWLAAVGIGGAGLLALEYLLRPVGTSAVPVAAANALALPILGEGAHGMYPGAGAGALLAALLLAGLAVAWVRLLLKEDPRTGRRAPRTGPTSGSPPEARSSAAEPPAVSGRTGAGPGP